jgi:hypothetical protein
MVRAERHRQELPQRHRAVQPVGAAEMDRQVVRRELAQLLTAAAAGSDDLGAGPDDDAFEPSSPRTAAPTWNFE